MEQVALFRPAGIAIEGFDYRPDFVTSREEAQLLSVIQTLPLREARYRQFVAKRRIVSYGGSYDFSRRRLEDAAPVPAFLLELRARMADWVGVPADELAHATIAEYRPRTQLGWHRDVPDFELVAGVSLIGPCRMRFRPYTAKNLRREQTLTQVLERRSAYVLRQAARWKWQHSIPPTPGLRYSITFRTRVAK